MTEQLVNGINLRILVIEDNSIARRMAKVAFEANGCHVDCVTTGKEAIAKINETYDLVLLDLGLPDMDGLEVAKLIRQKQDSARPFPIVALTAHAETEKQESTIQAGMDGFVSKPLTMGKCETMISQFCKKTNQNESP